MIKDKNLFGFLKSRAIFTRRGVKTYHESTSFLEQKGENRNRAEHPRKKAKHKR